MILPLSFESVLLHALVHALAEKRALRLLVIVCMFMAPATQAEESLNSLLCAEGASEAAVPDVLQEAVALGIVSVDEEMLQIYREAYCQNASATGSGGLLQHQVQQREVQEEKLAEDDANTVLMADDSAPDAASYVAELAADGAEADEDSELAEEDSTRYDIYLAADLQRGNRHENEYIVEVSREQELTTQLRWSVGGNYSLLEDFYEEFDGVGFSTAKEQFTTYGVNSELTYQSWGNPKLIGFADISHLSNDFTGVEQETSVMLGGGYALWGEDYHADCEVLKYSVGVGRRGRELSGSGTEQRNFVSHKLSLKYPVMDTVCVSVKQSLRQFIGYSSENITITSVDTRFNLTDIISLSVRYLLTNDKGAQAGFEPRDERLRFGIEVEL
ncbi:MAG: DUF481 domain-containing protein [Pseudomonadales bacterium]|nr:DUF481 domain-containing protein [Pseudomonadales bacterium]